MSSTITFIGSSEENFYHLGSKDKELLTNYLEASRLEITKNSLSRFKELRSYDELRINLEAYSQGLGISLQEYLAFLQTYLHSLLKMKKIARLQNFSLGFRYLRKNEFNRLLYKSPFFDELNYRVIHYSGHASTVSLELFPFFHLFILWPKENLIHNTMLNNTTKTELAFLNDQWKLLKNPLSMEKIKTTNPIKGLHHYQFIDLKKLKIFNFHNEKSDFHTLEENEVYFETSLKEVKNKEIRSNATFTKLLKKFNSTQNFALVSIKDEKLSLRFEKQSSYLAMAQKAYDNGNLTHAFHYLQCEIAEGKNLKAKDTLDYWMYLYLSDKRSKELMYKNTKNSTLKKLIKNELGLCIKDDLPCPNNILPHAELNTIFEY